MARVEDDTREGQADPLLIGRRRSLGVAARALRWWPFAVAVSVLVALDAAVYAFIKRHGVRETGDEPHYLVVARAVSHFTVHPLQAYKVDLRTHQLFAWAAGTRPTNLSLQLYTGPHGPVGDHPIGLSVFLAPFVAAGGERLGRLAVMALGCAGIVYFFHRSSRLAGLGVRGRIAYAAVLAGPALWLAATQIYPDFVTGVLLACAFTDVATMEVEDRLDWTGVAVSGASVAFVPWLHQQNLLAAVLATAAFLLFGWRARHRPGSRAWAAAVVIAAVGLTSWLLMLAYNLYAYGHAVGLPQPFPTLNGAGATEIIGLLFDRHQGLFVQVPTAAVGLVGLWLARRAAPAAAAATLLGAASLIYLNGTFIHAPYGGLSFAGRFQWASLVPILIWSPFALGALERAGRRIWAFIAGTVVMWVLQAVPILSGRHVYYNQQLLPGSPWDPAGYPGWWGRVDRLVPVLIPGGPQFGSPWFALLVTIVVLAAGTAVVAAASRPGAGSLRLALPVLLVVAAGTGGLAAVAPLPLPDRALVFPGADVGSPLVTGPNGASVSVPLTGVEPGTYLIAVSYNLQGPSGSAIEPFCQPHPVGPRSSAAASLRPGDGVASVRLHCAGGTLWLDAAVLPRTTVRIETVRVTKTSSG